MQLDMVRRLPALPWPSWAGSQELTDDPERLEKCRQYSDDPEQLAATVAALSVRAEFLGVLFYFDDDKAPRPVLRVTLSRKGAPAGREFVFGFGLALGTVELWTDRPSWSPGSELVELPGGVPGVKRWASWYDYRRARDKARERESAGLLYSILCSLGSDYHTPAAFSEFCAEFGYDEDSRRALATWELCNEFAAGLRRLMTEADAAAMPR